MASKSISKVLILDFGSQFTQLIARKVREIGTYCEILPWNTSIDTVKAFGAGAIILSGGPRSVYDADAPTVDVSIFEMNVPILGICYGMQLISHLLGGEVTQSDKKEYGRTEITLLKRDGIFANLPETTTVWMSHGDAINRLPNGFEIAACSDNTPNCAIQNAEKKIFAFQFHPEVVHSERGVDMLRNFLNIAGVKNDWEMRGFVEREVKRIREVVGSDNVILGLSGGVDSSVAAVLINKAIGKELKCIFVNNGVLRANEAEQVIETFRNAFSIELIYVNAEDQFLDALAGVTEPELKRKTIGRLFIEIFDKEAHKIQNVKFLAQGTLYPDVIESVPVKGASEVIKSHHNVGGLPEKMHLKLLEPFRELFKDEVRQIGRDLEVPDFIVSRQPFPGPGLSVRCLGEVTREKLAILRAADLIVQEEVKAAGLYKEIWQSFAVLLPVRSVGVQGDGRTYSYTCALRFVQSSDGMTADWVKVDYAVLEKISSRITNEVRGFNRVVYDISSKPPATIEWE